MFRKLFIDHPASVNERFGEHMRFAVRFGWEMIKGGLAALVHALVPAWHQATASEAVRDLHARLFRARIEKAQMPMPPAWLKREDGVRLAFRYRPGRGDKPTLVFLPGYASDMQGSKAITLDQWAAETGHAILRLDYSGCGESEGRFEDGTLALWRDDARRIIKAQVPRQMVLVGSSMGGWLALLLARDFGARVAGLVGIAAAPDFTAWGFSEAEKAILQAEGRLLRASDYGPEPMLTTQAFWESGESLHVLDAPLSLDYPVRLLHGQRDADVPWEIALKIAEQTCSANVQLHLVKDGDHRLSRPEDLELLTDVIARLMENL